MTTQDNKQRAKARDEYKAMLRKIGRKQRQLTKQLVRDKLVSEQPPKPQRETANFEHKRLVLCLSPTVKTTALVSEDKPLYLGRDVLPMARPEGSLLDLTPYDAFDLGVSRQHAVIRRPTKDKLTVSDLGSNNGTFINGARLQAKIPYTLHNEDRLQLGKLLITVIFEPVTTNL